MPSTEETEETEEQPHLDWSGINAIFYQSDPADYFETRSTLAILYAANPPALGDALSEGLEYGPLALSFTVAAESCESDEDDRLRFVITEAQVLYHHTIEALLRMYLAHRENTPCPWLEISSTRSFAKFKETVERRFVDKEHIPDETEWTEEIAWLFLAQHLEDIENPATLAAVDHIERSIRMYAADFLKDSHQYNAAKHGLAVNPVPDAALSIGDPDTDIYHTHTGPALHILEFDGNPRRWRMTTRWAKPETILAYQRVAVLLLRSLWTIGRARYTDADEIVIFEMPKPVYELVPREGSSITQFSMDLRAMLDTQQA